MEPRLARLFEGERVPRYTSYPTAPHFSPAVDADIYAGWLCRLPEDARLSLYLHIPYCRELCWYCGCHTYITRRDDRVDRYRRWLEQEIEQVASLLPNRMRVVHLHFGGGTPSVLGAEGLARIFARLHRHFEIEPGAERAIELDPRVTDPQLVRRLGELGITRASLGVQTTDARVQEAIHRIQPRRQVEDLIERLREAGIRELSVDLLYGLPRQDVDSVRASAREMAELRPNRLAVFGYAHLPDFRKHQRLIREGELPDTVARAAQFAAMARELERHGYVRIGLDHFALPGDAMARAVAEGTLRRNFQGYTTDPSDVLLGFGASAIGELPAGYVQNHADLRSWRRRVEERRLPVCRGLVLTPEDRAVRAVIERIMCFGAVDLDALAADLSVPRRWIEPDPDRLARLRDLGIVEVTDGRIRVPDRCRPFLRLVAATFDRYLEAGTRRHAVAI